jgi:hypothetical protein
MENNNKLPSEKEDQKTNQEILDTASVNKQTPQI